MKAIMLWKYCFYTPKSPEGDFPYSPLGVGGQTD